MVSVAIIDCATKSSLSCIVTFPSVLCLTLLGRLVDAVIAEVDTVEQVLLVSVKAELVVGYGFSGTRNNFFVGANVG